MPRALLFSVVGLSVATSVRCFSVRATSQTGLGALGTMSLQRPLCLVTDIDGTLHGDDAPMRELLAMLRAARDAGSPRAMVVYNTGRSLPSFERLHAEDSLDLPDVFVGGTGTEVYTYGEDGAPSAAQEYMDMVAQCGWDKGKVEGAVGRAVAAHSEQAPDAVTFDTDNSRNMLKHAMTVTAKSTDAFLRLLEAELAAAGVPLGSTCQAVVCSHFEDPALRYVDLVPQPANKGAATMWVVERFGFAPEDVLVAGDSGNDLAMFELLPERLPGARGVVVGNPKSELAEWASTSMPADSCHKAGAPAAGGILEALRKYGWLS